MRVHASARKVCSCMKFESPCRGAVGHDGGPGCPRPGPLGRRAPPDAQTPERRARLGRRQPLLGMRTAAPKRLAGPSGRLTPDSEAPMAWLNARRAPRDDAVETRLRARPRWRAHDALLPRVPGLGPVCARTLRLARPALGTRTRQPSAAVVGVAPLHGDSGPLRGRRILWGGRAPVRTGLDMGPLVATRCHPPSTAFEQRRLAAGPITKVALTACRHTVLTMLHAMLKHRAPGKGQEVQN